MTLLHPALLATGLAALAIPIIIHLLFRRRRKPVLWGAMRFLLEAYTKQRRTLTIEQLMLLLIRCAIIAAVALAVGRPLLTGAAALDGGDGRDVYILIDNSLTAAVHNSEGQTALDRHKAAAVAILDALGASDRAGLIALASPSESIVAPASSDLSGVRAALDRVELADSQANLPDALRVVASASAADAQPGAHSERTAIVILSDFYEGSVDLSRDAPVLFPVGAAVTVLASAPTQKGVGNVQIERVEPMRSLILRADETVGASAPVRVSLRRFGEAVSRDDSTTVQLRALRVDRTAGATAESVTRATVQWRAGETERVVGAPAPALPAAVDEGFAVITAEIDRDALVADNSRSVALRMQDQLHVAIAGRRADSGVSLDRLAPEEWLKLALAPTANSPIEITNVDPAAFDAPTLASVSVVALVRPDLVDAQGWTLLRSFVDAGGLLLVFPPASATVHLWTDAFVDAMDIPWTFPRESVDFDDAPAQLSTDRPRAPLLRLIAAELPSLARPVHVRRALLPALSEGASPLLALGDGGAWLAASPAGARSLDAPGADNEASLSRGQVVYIGSALASSWTDLPARPIMVALMQEIVRQGAAMSSASIALDAGAVAPAPARTVELQPVATVGGEVRTPVAVNAEGLTVIPIRKSGIFAAVDDRGAVRGVVVVSPASSASSTVAQAPDAVKIWLSKVVKGGANIIFLNEKDISSSVGGALSRANAADRSSISFPLLIAALVLALLETALARVFSHAARSSMLGKGAQA